MEYKNVEYRIEDNIGILTIDRPKVLNALNAETIREIRSVLDEVKRNQEISGLGAINK